MRKALGLAMLTLLLLCGRGDAQDAPIGVTANTVLAGSLIVKNAGPARLYSFNAANNNAAARWVLVYDSPTVPGDGTTVPAMWFLLAGSGSPPNNAIFIAARAPVLFLTGLVFVCSSTGPFTKTIQTDCAFSVEAQ